MQDLADFRKEIDRLDYEILRSVVARLRLCEEIAILKRDSGVPMMQPERVAEVKNSRAASGEKLGVDPAFTIRLFETIIAEACRIEDRLMAAEEPRK
ncbi:hypothetical protein XI00_38240 [Bradyrhizobium sp. CCBAU 21359]|uniref:chorismate mutase n=1 Tax=Bradyrhizobium sp. CCBAU 21359 TaxID=1325080 RepID=UPI0023059243|nr:chorismate mutase family protein [Bradyrhizobium sp. CCBAU 21359]MDA9460012.1 hypothetical protein [Bradyrhizobium sp. CCBAU 21359]